MTVNHCEEVGPFVAVVLKTKNMVVVMRKGVENNDRTKLIFPM